MLDLAQPFGIASNDTKDVADVIVHNFVVIGGTCLGRDFERVWQNTQDYCTVAKSAVL